MYYRISPGQAARARRRRWPPRRRVGWPACDRAATPWTCGRRFPGARAAWSCACRDRWWSSGAAGRSWWRRWPGRCADQGSRSSWRCTCRRWCSSLHRNPPADIDENVVVGTMNKRVRCGNRILRIRHVGGDSCMAAKQRQTANSQTS